MFGRHCLQAKSPAGMSQDRFPDRLNSNVMAGGVHLDEPGFMIEKDNMSIRRHKRVLGCSIVESPAVAARRT